MKHRLQCALALASDSENCEKNVAVSHLNVFQFARNKKITSDILHAIPKMRRAIAKNLFGVMPSNGVNSICRYCLCIKRPLNTIRNSIFVQLAKINPTGPKILVSTYDKNRNMNENTPMYLLYLLSQQKKVKRN